MKSLISSSFLWLSSSLQSVSSYYSTSSSNSFIYDEYQRVSIFHGENFVQKGFPWYPSVLRDTNHLTEMQSWGFNTIRLGVITFSLLFQLSNSLI